MLPSNYLALPSDISGSMSKNRFSYEMLWGIYYIFDIYDQTEDFIAIFDYVCDVEIHTHSSDSYYQIKTKKKTETYTPKTLCKTGKAKDGSILSSILGKLYLIKAASDPNRQVKVAVVANTNLSFNKKEYTELLEQPLVSIDLPARDAIIRELKKEFPTSDIDLSNVYFIRTFIDLEHPEESLIGKIVKWYPNNRRCEVRNPNALYRLISDTVREKACYEWKSGSHEDFIHKKAITKESFDRIVDQHTQNSISGVEASKEWINENIGGFGAKIKAQQELARIVECLLVDERLQLLVKSIESYVHSKKMRDDLSLQQLMDEIQCEISKDAPADYSSEEIQKLILLTLKKVEEQACLF